METLGTLFSRTIPAYFWLAVGYSLFVAVVTLLPQGDVSADGVSAALLAQDCVLTDQPLYLRIETALDCRVVTLPLFSGNAYTIDWMTLFIVAGFVCAWIEVVRATNIRDTARNDTWSLIVTIISIVLFAGVSVYGTTAFLIVAVVGFGDVLLDRYVGQAVARRDFGGLVGAGK